ncbi:unnamed protein product [Anisakis simplex]|uniref:Guanylate cyclase n=1 Tax=Anisakis simplex TaxID=6269 RepID=A0A158PPN7_ANISI|nr:unnamed protein product [Anisakis simplex]
MIDCAGPFLCKSSNALSTILIAYAFLVTAEPQTKLKYFIKVGMLLPKHSPISGFTQSASAVMLAVEELQAQHMINDVNFTFIWQFEDCNEEKALRLAIDMILKDHVNLILGPPCNARREGNAFYFAAALDVGVLASSYDIPNFQWGPTTASQLVDSRRFPTVVTVTPDSLSLGVALCALLTKYNWTEFALVYAGTSSGLGHCAFLQQDLEMSLKMHPSALFGEQVIEHMKDYPFYCNSTECPTNVKASRYAGSLYNTMFLYGLALNKTLRETSGDEWKSGRVTTQLYQNASSTIWSQRDGKVPLAIPICGFTGNNCPFNFMEHYWGYVAAAGIIIATTVILLIAGTIYMMREKAREVQRENSLWQLSFSRLVVPDERSVSMSKSSVLGSNASTKSHVNANTKNSDEIGYFMLDNELVYAEKFPFRVQVAKENFSQLRAMRTLEHSNLNRFIGLVIDAPTYLVVWKYCSRGSLQACDVIQEGKMQIDSFFAYCLIRDIVDGLNAIHSSPIGSHGSLTSANCLIDERWQVKISNFGIRFLRAMKNLTDDELLWTAPELLRDPQEKGTKCADIYSLAIICAELMCLSRPWNLGERKEQSAEIIYMVRHGVTPPFRPDLSNIAHQDLNPALLFLIRDCWSEDPQNRPQISTVKELIQNMNPGRSQNLMDHVFAMLEDYAGTLEAEVEQRTKELIEEKKKSDILLYRMMPQQVAEKLKLGQNVEPEAFATVTIFFSDVVSFTKLASRCSPMQVVTLLNDLYTNFDGIIDAHDVYKVETIGDGYLCVSGLPKRNGNEHAREIANMALEFIDSLRTFRIAQMPDERINIRVGIHTGPCVAGVVGLTMPRYCLFGDTVNTASRMESNGKPGQIHLSGEANRFLTQVLGGFETVSRGEVIIKGKGVMETFWLLGHEGHTLISAPETSIYKKFVERDETTSKN